MAVLHSEEIRHCMLLFLFTSVEKLGEYGPTQDLQSASTSGCETPWRFCCTNLALVHSLSYVFVSLSWFLSKDGGFYWSRSWWTTLDCTRPSLDMIQNVLRRSDNTAFIRRSGRENGGQQVTRFLHTNNEFSLQLLADLYSVHKLLTTLLYMHC